eukprot:UN25107
MFMELANIHAMRQSIDDLQTLIEDEKVKETEWSLKLDTTGWMQHIRSIFSVSITLAKLLGKQGLSVCVHCSDGWDRTSQICFIAQLLLDPHYRTIQGFQNLIRKDFLGFGYKFSDRDYNHKDPNERSPVFLQALEIVYHIMDQYPRAFEFTTAYLVFLCTHFQSGLFGNFLYNTERERVLNNLSSKTLNIWDVQVRKNPLYDPKHRQGECIYPVASIKIMRFFKEYWLR